MQSLREPRALIWDDRLTNDDKAFVATLNEALRQLSEKRAVEITVSGPLARSKIAWKLVSYQHALLHRIVALIDGAAIARNNRSTFLSRRG